MKDKKHHIDPKHELNELDELLFEKVDIKFSRSKEDVLAQIKSSTPAIQKSTSRVWKIAAAVAFFVTSSVIFMALYSRQFTTNQYEIVDISLPDGSSVKLNENSELSFKPFAWIISRSVVFEGEAFFEVTKGSKFSVESKNGTTSVLGTSFNINSRTNNYTVFCKTGKVLVSNLQSNTVLTPNQQASVGKNGSLINTVALENTVLQWINGLLSFQNNTLEQVFEELEKTYNISISVSRKVDLYATYSGIFTLPNDATEALSIICISNDLEFDQTSPSAFSISKK